MIIELLLVLSWDKLEPTILVICGLDVSENGGIAAQHVAVAFANYQPTCL